MQGKQFASNGVHINNEAHKDYSVVTIGEVCVTRRLRCTSCLFHVAQTQRQDT